MNAASRPTALAQLLLGQVIRSGDTVIDATAGNGHDTVFLARAVGPGGRVLAFDVQAAAIQSAQARLAEAGLMDPVTLFHESHVNLAERAEARPVAAVMFNLGYLPGKDRSRITETAETLAALDAAANVLRPGGMLSVVCYPGHPGGEMEAAAVTDWFLARAAERWAITRHGAIGTLRPAPFLLLGVRPHQRTSDGRSIRVRHDPGSD
jgi:predicted methyltransferase